MMKKATSALAVAALLGAGSASAVTFQVNEDTTFAITGNIQIAYSDMEVESTNDSGVGTGEAQSVTDVYDNGTTIRFDVEHNFGNGLTGYARLEEDGFDAADSGKSDQVTDEAYLGLKGDFGSIQFGHNDSTYDDFISDYFDYQETITPTAFSSEKPRALQFKSSDYNGFTFALEAQINGDADEAISEDYAYSANDGKVSLTAGKADDNGNTADSVSLAGAVRYTAENLTLTLAADQRGNIVSTDYNGDGTGTEGDDLYVNNPIIGVVASTTIAGIALDFGYQTFDNADETGADVTTDITSVGGRYTYGPGDLYGVYQQVDKDNSQERDELVVGVSYNVGSNMYVYAENRVLDKALDAGDAFAVGATYFW